MDKRDLRIEFRAEPYTSSSHVLEYRFSPNQDLTYYKDVSVFGLFTIKIKKKYSTKWRQPLHYFNHVTAYSQPEEENYSPFLLHDKKELDKFKYSYYTYGEFADYIAEIDNKEYKAWCKDRKEYLENNCTWY